MIITHQLLSIRCGDENLKTDSTGQLSLIWTSEEYINLQIKRV